MKADDVVGDEGCDEGAVPDEGRINSPIARSNDEEEKATHLQLNAWLLVIIADDE
jgi:hypothetical protein